MIKLLITTGLLMATVIGFGQSSLNHEYFTNNRFRYNFCLNGNANKTHAIGTNKYVEPHWGGSLNRLIDPFDYGTYRYQVFDSTQTKLLFSKGFSPLFWEWQTTAEAKYKNASFEQAVFFPMPQQTVVLTIDMRNSQNEWQTLLTDTIHPNDISMIRDQPEKHESIPLLHSGAVEDKVDILIVAEGYTSQERDLFIQDAQRMTDSLFACQPFSNYRDRFNINALMLHSVESGTDIPNNGIYKNTVLNSSFNTFGSERYLTTLSMVDVYRATAAEPWDHIIILVNSDKYGGGGCYNFECITTARNEQSTFVFIHEFGHAFGGLGDEYYNASTAYESFYSKTFEPWEPNLTSLVHFESKWKSMLASTTPIPTLRTELFAKSIGVFEGGGYESKGIYSPAQTCWMKERKAGAFCPVCNAAIEKVILWESK